MREKRLRALILFTIIFLLVVSALFGQSESVDWNRYYRFPLSVGGEYQVLSPFEIYGSAFNVFEISALVKIPLPPLPLLQPSLRGGVIQFVSMESEPAVDLSHFDIFVMVGGCFSHRFARTFELGGELLAGMSQSYYAGLMETESPGSLYGDKNFITQGGLHISLIPSYNFALDIHPNLKYIATGGSLKDFDGLISGLGLSASYRLGEDPDRYPPTVEYLTIEEIRLPPLFAGMQYYYSREPLASLTIRNDSKKMLQNIEVSFYQKGYMDSPTPCGTIAQLGRGESAPVKLYASFNDNIFKVEGLTPLVGEISVKYQAEGRHVEQKKSLSCDLYDKTALVWDDDRKAAAYITPADSALKNYSRFIQLSCRDSVYKAFNWPLQFAMQVYYGLKEIDLIYQGDPVHPYGEVKMSGQMIDSISLPRDSLKRLSGDCDDLTVLYTSLLESIGIETGFITLPDHIFPVFNTKLPAEAFREIHPDPGMVILRNGEVWLPVEITLVDKTDFLSAWKRGMNNYRKGMSAGSLEFCATRESQKVFKPIALKEEDIGLQYGDPGNIQQEFKRDISEVVKWSLEYSLNGVREKEGLNKAGIRAMKLGEYTLAETLLKKAAEADNTYILPIINLGNLFYLQGIDDRALTYYLAAEEYYSSRGEHSSHYVYLLLNISVVYSRTGDRDKAFEYFKKAEEYDPGITGNEVYRNFEVSLGEERSLKGSEEILPGDLFFADE